jgi:hypothetical protein
MLTGRYAKDAEKAYKTPQGKELLAAVREAIRLIDEAMKGPSTFERGKRMAQIVAGLEIAADRFDLFGEKRGRAA